MRRAYLLTTVLALVLLPSNVVAAAVPLLREEWSANATEVGWVFAAYQVGYVVSVLFVLPLTDRVRPGMILVWCTVLASLSFVLFPLLARDVWSASGLRFLAGLSRTRPSGSSGSATERDTLAGFRIYGCGAVGNPCDRWVPIWACDLR